MGLTLRTHGGADLRASVTPYFVVRPPQPMQASQLLTHGVAVRDTTSFGLPGCWRVSAQPPAAQDALTRAVDTLHAAAP